MVTTREPYDCAPGRKIRELAQRHVPVAAEEELALFLEQRRLHVASGSRPRSRGAPSCSPTATSSRPSPTRARAASTRQLLAASEAEFPLPDLVLLLELAPAEGLARVAARGGTAEPAFERADFLARVREIFDALDRPYLERVDAAGSPDAVEARLAAAIHRRLGL